MKFYETLICSKIYQTLQNIKMTSDYRPQCLGMEPVVWTYTTSNNCVMLGQPAGTHYTSIFFSISTSPVPF